MFKNVFSFNCNADYQLFRFIWLSQVMLGVIAGCMIVLLVSFRKLCIPLTKRGVKFAKVLFEGFRKGTLLL